MFNDLDRQFLIRNQRIINTVRYEGCAYNAIVSVEAFHEAFKDKYGQDEVANKIFADITRKLKALESLPKQLTEKQKRKFKP